MCLDLLPENVRLLEKSLHILSDSHDAENYISFPGAVLLNQVMNHLDLESLEHRHFDECFDIFKSSQRDYMQKLSYRYDQIEQRDNSEFTKKMFGVDVVNEVV
jgi:hypothetical protein